MNWWWYQWILETYQHFNTFDTLIVNEQKLKTRTRVIESKLCIFSYFNFLNLKKNLIFKFFLMFFFKFFFVTSVPGGGWGYDWWKHQYGWHLSVLSHRALGTAECDESYCIERGDHIWSSGEFFYHESYCDVVMTIYGFQICLWRQFRGVGLRGRHIATVSHPTTVVLIIKFYFL